MKSESLEGIIRGLMNYEARPDSVGPTEMMTVIALVVKGGIEKPVLASSVTLGMEIGVADSTVKRTLDALCGDDIKWIEKKSGKGRANANTLMVLLDRLPVPEEIKKTIISEPMRVLAKQYSNRIKFYGKSGKVRRFSRGNLQRMAHNFQQFLDRHCQGDEALLRSVLRFALADPRYRTKAQRGPHFLRRDFSKIVTEVKSQAQPTEKAA